MVYAVWWRGGFLCTEYSERVSGHRDGWLLNTSGRVDQSGDNLIRRRSMWLFVSLLRTTTCLCLAYLCYDSAPGGESRLPDKTPRVKLPEKSANIILSGQHGL